MSEDYYKNLLIKYMAYIHRTYRISFDHKEHTELINIKESAGKLLASIKIAND